MSLVTLVAYNTFLESHIGQFYKKLYKDETKRFITC